MSEISSTVVVPPALAKIAIGRDFINTEEFAQLVGRAPQTVRKSHWLVKHYLGVRPLKLGNRLMWPVHAVSDLLDMNEAAK